VSEDQEGEERSSVASTLGAQQSLASLGRRSAGLVGSPPHLYLNLRLTTWSKKFVFIYWFDSFKQVTFVRYTLAASSSVLVAEALVEDS
jgi:hypothetical protein